jgi:hypothetical protein
MSRRFDAAVESYWRVDFIQPATAHDNRCIMLYGEQGEIVGPLTNVSAELWMSYFDNGRQAAGITADQQTSHGRN